MKQSSSSLGSPSWVAAWRPAWPLLPALLAVMVYLPSLAGSYVYDDSMIISDNEFVRAPGALWMIASPDHYYGIEEEALEGSKEQSYRPLATLTHVLECMVFFESPQQNVAGGFRLTSLYLHALNALLVCAVARRLFGVSRLAAIAAGTLFAIHPVATEAIVVASFREDPLCLWFLLIGLLCYGWRGHAPGGRGIAWSLAGSLCFLAAMLSKEVGLVALPLALLADAWFGRVPWRERQPMREVIRVGSVLAVSALFLWIRFHWAYFPGEGSTPYPGGVHGTLTSSVFTMLPVFAHYARLFVFPDVLRADYMFEVHWSLRDPAVVAAGLTLVAVGALAVAAALRSRTVAFGLLFTLCTLGPVSNIIPIRNICAERYLYVPLAGIAFAAGVLVAWGWAQCARRDWRRGAVIGATCVVVVLFARTWWRVVEWKSNDTIWIATVRDEPLSTRGNISAAAFHNVRAMEFQARARDANAQGGDGTADGLRAAEHFQQVRIFAQQLTRVPWKVPDPRHGDAGTAPLVEVYSDAQVDLRRFEAWRLLAELDWIEYGRLKESDNEDSALVYLRRARDEIVACRTIVDDIKARGEGTVKRSMSLYDLHGRIHLALPEMKWREYWSIRERAFTAREQERHDDAIRYDRRALELGDDAEYGSRLSAAQRRQIAEERWRVFADLGASLEAASQVDEARQVHAHAVREATQLRRLGRWPINDTGAWWSLAGAGRLTLPPDERPPEAKMQLTEGLAGAVRRALALVAPPDRATALAEGRRLAALGESAAALVLVDWATGTDAPGTGAEADPDAPWAPAVDRLWIAEAAGRSPTATDLAPVRAALVAHAQRGGKPFFDAWDRAFKRFEARTNAPDSVADQRAVWLLLRARWLSADPLYRTAVQGLTRSEAPTLEGEAWKIEHELWWWYRHALSDRSRAAEHGRAAGAAWEKLVAAGRTGGQETDPRTFDKLQDCAAEAGDRAGVARYARQAEELRAGSG